MKIMDDFFFFLGDKIMDKVFLKIKIMDKFKSQHLFKLGLDESMIFG